METNPEKLIEKIPGLLGELNRRVSFLRAETEGIQDQWEGLANLGAQRPDHAAQLLIMLEPHLEGLATFCRNCAEHIRLVKADPFERNVRQSAQ